MQADNGTGIIKDDQEPQRPRQPKRHQPWSSSTVHAIEFSNHHHTPTTPTREPRQAVSGSKRKTYTTTPTHATPPPTTHPQTPTNTTPPPACRKPNTTPPNQDGSWAAHNPNYTKKSRTGRRHHRSTGRSSPQADEQSVRVGHLLDAQPAPNCSSYSVTALLGDFLHLTSTTDGDLFLDHQNN